MAELPAHARKPEIHIKDPAAAISFHRLKNGLQVILAPTKNAKTIQLRLEVEVGQESESPREYGISHLLEHALFRHPDLTENMSFAQMVDQIGGQANGHTERRLTSYEAHVPAQQGLWLVKTYYKMIFSRQLRHEDIERSRNEVLLEIGDVHPLMQFIGFDPFEWLSLTYLKPTGFYESQFGVPWDRDLYTDNVERLSTHRLTLQQVQNYYDRFYYPNNMRLFISGPLEKMPYLQTVESVFGQIPARQGATLPPPAMPRHPSKRPFYSVKSTTSTATIETGIKVWDLEYRDEILLNVYSEYLAHELMKEIRNRRGLTYTVLPEVAIQNRWGYVGISMEAQKREYWNILKQVRNLIQRHATEGLTESEHAEALSLSARAFHLHDNDSETMLAFALTLDRFRRYYEHPESPYLVLRSIELEEFNRRLKKLFVPERAYAELVAPPLFFEGDLFLLGLLTIF